MSRISAYQIDSVFGASHMARQRAGGAEVGAAFGGMPGDPSGDDPHSFSSSAAVYGYEHFVVPEVVREHPDWTSEQVTRESLVRFNLRLSENVSILRREQQGKNNTTVWREDVVDGERILVIHGGQFDGYTLDQLWTQSDQHDRDRGTSFVKNKEEWRAQKEIQRALLNGEASSSASIIGHPDSVKLIQTYHRRSDGLYYSEQIDLEGLTGRTLTFAEGKAVMAALHHDHKQSAKIAEAHHDHFMVTKGEITASEVKTIARAIVLTSSPAQHSTEQISHQRDNKQAFSPLETPILVEAGDLDRVHGEALIDTTRIVFHDTGEAIKGITVLLHDKEKRKEAADRLLGFSVVQKIRRIFGRGEESIDNKTAAAFSLSMSQKSERLTIEKIREKPVRTVEIIRKQHEEMKKGMAVLGMLAETGVAVHAAQVILARLKEKLPTPVVAMKKSIERHAKKELRKKKKDSVKVQPLKPERVEPLRARKERKKKKIRADASREVKTGNRKEQGRRVKRAKEIGVKRVAAASEIILSASKKRERREKRKMRQAVEKSMRRHKKTELKRETKKDSAKVQPLIEKKRSIQKKEREAVGEMVFGWMVWMILARKDSETPKSNLKMSHPALHGETLRRQEETLWILLSIIYYLTAIREQGMQSNPTNPTNTPIRPKKNARVVPQYAVIFAYNS